MISRRLLQSILIADRMARSGDAILKRRLVWLLFKTGLLGAYHSLRNRRVLTVVSFHRVLAEDDPRWRTCDHLYTMSDRLFEQCLEFFREYYSIVTLDDVLRLRRSGERLPPRALLITFDDGWADNHDYAFPVLRKFGLPAALFVATDTIGRHEAFFQERLIAAWRTKRLGEKVLASLWERTAPPEDRPRDVAGESSLRALIARLQCIPASKRDELLESLADVLADPQRQMLTSEEIRRMHRAGVAIGTHGKTHEPLTSVPDVDSELRDSKHVLAEALGCGREQIRTLSLPFSKQNEDVIQRARQAGYELVFGGGLCLNPLRGGLPFLSARVGVIAHDVMDDKGDLRPQTLAAYLFRRPKQRLADHVAGATSTR